jgi:serine protease Do
MIDASPDRAGSATRRPASLRKKLLFGTALAVIASGGLVAGEGFLVGPTAQAAAPTTEAASQPVQAPDFADLAQKVTPAVVSIRVRESAPAAALDNGSGSPLQGFGNLPPELRRFFEQQMPNAPATPQPGLNAMALGSGFLVSADGYVVTNNHVVANASDFTVTTQDGTEHPAKLIGADDKTDIALLKINGDHSFPYVKFSQDPIRVGEWVMAVGNPFGLGGTVTAGIVSATGRAIDSGPYDNYIQIDAPVNRGNSGGPSFNLKGEVIGVNTAIYSPSGGSVGIAFDVPASTAEHVIADLKDHGKVVRGWLGVQIQPITPAIADSLGLSGHDGALVAEPQANSPASGADINAGDAILAVDGKPVKDPRDLAMRIAADAPGSTVTISVWRDGAKKDVQVRLGTLPGSTAMAKADTGGQAEPSAFHDFGLTLAPTPDHHGVAIAKVDDNGAAADAGLQPGDVILSVDNNKVSKPADVKDQVAAVRERGLKGVLLQVRSGTETRYVGLSFANA